MPQLTQQQADDLADFALQLKSAVSDYREQFYQTLTPQLRRGLQTFANQLGDQVDHLTAVAIKTTLADLQQTLAGLKDITKGVKQAVDNLNDGKKIITVATALVGVGSAIATSNPTALLAALADTTNALQS